MTRRPTLIGVPYDAASSFLRGAADAPPHIRRALELIGADVVELNPVRDPSGVTAMVAAKLVKEVAAKMINAART